MRLQSKTKSFTPQYTPFSTPPLPPQAVFVGKVLSPDGQLMKISESRPPKVHRDREEGMPAPKRQRREKTPQLPPMSMDPEAKPKVEFDLPSDDSADLEL